MDPYSDESAAAPDSAGAGDVAEKADPKSGEEKSALIPKSLIEGKQPGETVSFKIVHLYEDEAEIECVGEKDDSAPKSTMDQSTDALDAMASEQ